LAGVGLAEVSVSTDLGAVECQLKATVEIGPDANSQYQMNAIESWLSTINP
jgi:hypothetical protein